MNKGLNVFLIGVFCVFILILPFIIKIVPVGHVGVVKHLGEVNHKATLSEGFALILPIYTSVVKYDKRLITKDVEASGASNDLQEVLTTVSVQFSFLDGHSHLLQNIGNEMRFSDSILTPAIAESVKSVAAKYTAEELITKRQEVKQFIAQEIEAFLEKTLKQKGIDSLWVRIANVAITNFEFSEEFNNSIELKVRAEQQALQALNEKQKKITDAEAVAEQIRIESIAKANAIEREGRALNRFPQLIQLKQVEKWNGILPKVTGSYLPMLNIKPEN